LCHVEGAVADRYAMLLDGGFLKKKLSTQLGHQPQAADIVAFANGLRQNPKLIGLELLRIYYYDARPFDEKRKHPLSGATKNFATTLQAQQGKQLLDALEVQADFAVRYGTLTMAGWKLGRGALLSLAATPRLLAEADVVPDLTQKGVDLRLGLDMALMSFKQLVKVLVVVSGDSDLVPAIKLARREGVRVYLDVMGHWTRREMAVHADLML